MTLDLLHLVPAAERIGIAPHEWLSICEWRTIRPPTAEEWREAVLSTVLGRDE